jgi:hypothetical protein
MNAQELISGNKKAQALIPRNEESPGINTHKRRKPRAQCPEMKNVKDLTSGNEECQGTSNQEWLLTTNLTTLNQRRH